MRRSVFAVVLLLGIQTGCKGEADDRRATASGAATHDGAAEADAAVVEPPDAALVEPPAWVLLTWGTTLRTAPSDTAPALILERYDDGSDPGRGRVLKVEGEAGEAGQWWQLTSIASNAGVEADEPPIEGLEPYAVTLYVPAGTGLGLVAREPAPEPKAPRSTAAPPLQSGGARPATLSKEWQIDADAPVYWANGTSAGTVRERHAYTHPGETRVMGGLELRCFPARFGPRVRSGTSLCFSPNDVHETGAGASGEQAQ